MTLSGFVLQHARALWVAAIAIRLLLVVYGTFQDEWFAVKYSDVDYSVVTDGARFVVEGQSPYMRDTYRYSPLLAYLMVPNVLWHASCGKLVFVAFDFVGAWLTRKLAAGGGGGAADVGTLCELAYLYNPLSIGISTRGSGDSIICAAVLATVWLLTRATGQGQEKSSLTMVVAAGAVHGFSVHWRLFPVIFSPTVLLLLPSWRMRFLFGTTSLTVFTALLAVFYTLYGWPFVWETFLYHVTRQDPRHNFSVWFYAVYLQQAQTQPDVTIRLLMTMGTMLPQVIVQLALLWQFAKQQKRQGALLLCFLLQTWAFVIFNKVVTAQYFLWYFALLPALLAARVDLPKLAKTVVVPWTVAELVWLGCAYRVEFLGEPAAFEQVFAAGLAFFGVNVMCMCRFVGIVAEAEEKKKKE